MFWAAFESIGKGIDERKTKETQWLMETKNGRVQEMIFWNYCSSFSGCSVSLFQHPAPIYRWEHWASIKVKWGSSCPLMWRINLPSVKLFLSKTVNLTVLKAETRWFCMYILRKKWTSFIKNGSSLLSHGMHYNEYCTKMKLFYAYFSGQTARYWRNRGISAIPSIFRVVQRGWLLVPDRPRDCTRGITELTTLVRWQP